MKKILAIFLAALMMFTTFGMVSSAAEVTGGEFKLEDALAIAAGWADADDPSFKPIVLVFDPGSAKMGTIYEGDLFKITSGPCRGMYALVSESFTVKNRVQLPGIKDAGDGMAANWFLETELSVKDENGNRKPIEIGSRTYASGSSITITEPMMEHDYLVFYAQQTVNEQTPIIATIMNIFYKVIKVIFGEQLAAKFEEIMLEFGVAIE